MSVPSSSTSGGHSTTMEQLLKDVFRLHKHTVNEFRGKQTQQQEAVTEAQRERDRYAEKVERLERELDILRADNTRLRDLRNISHSRQGEANCQSCPRLQKTISVMQDAYERSLLEKDRVIQSLEERLEAATKSISGGSRTFDSLHQSKESKAEVSDLNLSSRSHEGTSDSKEIPDSRSHSKSAGNQMSCLTSATIQRSTSSPSNENRPLSSSTNEKRSVSPSANEKRSVDTANQESSQSLSANHRSRSPANERSASPSMNLLKDASSSARTSQRTRRSDSPSCYEKQTEKSVTDDNRTSERPRLRKAVSESEKDSRQANSRNKEPFFSKQNQKECSAVDSNDKNPFQGPEDETSMLEAPQEENNASAERDMQEKTGAPRISPRSAESKLHLSRRNKRSRYVEEDRSGIDPKRQRSSPQSANLPSDHQVRNAASSSKDHLADLVPVEHTEQEKPAASSRVLVPETCDMNASLDGAREREKRQQGYPLLDLVVPETLDTNPVVIESSDEDDNVNGLSYSAEKTSPEKTRRGRADVLDEKARGKDVEKERTSRKGRGWLDSSRPDSKTPASTTPHETSSRYSQDSLPSLHSQAFADMTLPPVSKNTAPVIISDSPHTPAGSQKINSNNNNGISPCIFDEEQDQETGWLNARSTADADETMLPVHDRKLSETRPGREIAQRTHAKAALLSSSSNKNSPGTLGPASDSESPLLLQPGRVINKDGASGSKTADDLKTKLNYSGEKTIEEPPEADLPPKDSQSLSLLEGVSCPDRSLGNSGVEGKTNTSLAREAEVKSKDAPNRDTAEDELEKDRRDQQRSSSKSRRGQFSLRKASSLPSSSAVDLTATPTMEVDKSDEDDDIPNSADSGKSLKSLRSRRRRIHPRAMSVLQNASKTKKKPKLSGHESGDLEWTSSPSHKESILRQTTLSQMFERGSPERHKPATPVVPSSSGSSCQRNLQRSGDKPRLEKTSERDKSAPPTGSTKNTLKPSEASLHEIQNTTNDLQTKSPKKTSSPSKQRENRLPEFKKPQTTLSKRSLRGAGAGASLATESLDLRESLPKDTPSLALQTLDFLTESSQSSQGHVRGRDLNGSLDPDFNLTSMCEETEAADKERSRPLDGVRSNSPELKSCMQTVEICEEDDEGAEDNDGGEDIADVTMHPRFMRAHASAAPPMEDDSIPSSYIFPSTVGASTSLEPSQTGEDSAPGDAIDGLIFDDDDKVKDSVGSKRKQGKTSVLDCSFDRVPKKSTAPNYAYADVVRKHGERKKLKGASCQECEKYYRGLGVPEEEIAERIQECSRHRAAHLPPSTPPHYWSVGFPDTEECRNRGYIQEATSPKPFQNRRRRQLRSLFKQNGGQDSRDDETAA